MREFFMVNGSCEGCKWEDDISGCIPFGVEGYCGHYTVKED